jgi:hypothetical protein
MLLITKTLSVTFHLRFELSAHFWNLRIGSSANTVPFSENVVHVVGYRKGLRDNHEQLQGGATSGTHAFAVLMGVNISRTFCFETRTDGSGNKES